MNAEHQTAGLRMGDPSQPQREAVLAILAAALSPQGYEKILAIVQADQLLKQSSGQTIFMRHQYYVSIMSRCLQNCAVTKVYYYSSSALTLPP